MTGRLADKIALVTGGGSGIGRACALRFSKEGVRICVADLDLAAATETVGRVDPAGKTAIAVQIDTTDESANEAIVARCVETFGAVDILVAAAGIASPLRPSEVPAQPHTVLAAPTEQFRRVMEINLYRVMFSNRAVARWMVANGRGGSSINLASIMSKIPSPGGAYSVSKAGVWMLTKCLAQELAPHGVRVNAIGPGFIETPMTAALRANETRSRWAMGMTPIGRFGTAEEIASAALFLASDEAAFFTGEL